MLVSLSLQSGLLFWRDTKEILIYLSILFNAWKQSDVTGCNVVGFLQQQCDVTLREKVDSSQKQWRRKKKTDVQHVLKEKSFIQKYLKSCRTNQKLPNCPDQTGHSWLAVKLSVSVLRKLQTHLIEPVPQTGRGGLAPQEQIYEEVFFSVSISSFKLRLGE